MQDLLQANGLVLRRPRRNGIGYDFYVKAVVEQVACGLVNADMRLNAGQ